MRELWFVFKVFITTVLVILVMQMKVGDQRLESKVEAAIHSSPAVGYLQQVADGTALAVTHAFHAVTFWINSKISGVKSRGENQPGLREIFPEFKRSDSYVRRSRSKSEE